MNHMTRWFAMLLGMFTVKRISSKELADSEDSLDRSGSLSGSEGCLTPRALAKLKWLSKRKEAKRKAALLRVEQQYRKQDDMFWENTGAVWQRTILMGEKCEPPDFSGLILYDERGNRVPEYPAKSPRAGSGAGSLF
ncbi:hypothetical protein SELMODRAFT_408071 [Selaginella moellendorffii]|uniref:Uncharacterized protein n=1 Tax=Selaginella moellendorffii TaxID=88036 RepID=D8R738_SELML|nr:uncharacterized protein LOC9634717 [Selaginella moellendorffii]EFJ31457.1 hypothetical protein SELMODRAFT_408071 [Selaginella moellendorffii]|eukprot:XP_002966858.1 uncharacterized protein LOC9634717 [Selaginella moellendorffii]